MFYRQRNLHLFGKYRLSCSYTTYVFSDGNRMVMFILSMKAHWTGRSFWKGGGNKFGKNNDTQESESDQRRGRKYELSKRTPTF